MKFSVEFSSSSLKFLKANSIQEALITEKIKLALRKFRGEDANVDIKKLKGEWLGFYRIRIGKIRIIAQFQFELNKVYIEEIDWRGGVYK